MHTIESASVVVSFTPQPEGALASLSATEAVGRFHSWRGVSGRRRIVSVFAADRALPDAGLPSFDGCVVLAVSRRNGDLLPLTVVALEREADRRALRAFADLVDEWHVNLLGESRSERAAIVADLRARHAEPAQRSA